MYLTLCTVIYDDGAMCILYALITELQLMQRL